MDRRRKIGWQRKKRGTDEAAHGMERAVVEEELSFVLFFDTKYRLDVMRGGARALTGCRAPGHLICRPFGGASSPSPGSLHALLARFFRLRARLTFCAQFFELIVGQMLDAH